MEQHAGGASMTQAISQRPRRRRRQVTDAQEQPLPTLTESLRFIQGAAFLHFDEMRDFDVWSPNQPLLLAVRRSLCKHKSQVLAWMYKARACTCPSLERHRWS
jgi:hypothetical protein